MSTWTDVSVGLQIMTCWCGMPFACPEQLWKAVNEARTDQAIYCPLGHSNTWKRKHEVDKLKEQLNTEKQNTEFWREQTRNAEDEAAHAERRRRSAKAVATKLKKRVAEGKCPACLHSFPDLAGHIAEVHPGYGGEE